MNRSILVLLAAVGFASANIGPGAAEGSPLTLRDAVARTLTHSPDLGSAETAKQEAAAGARLARDAFHPEAWVSTTPGYSVGLPTTVAGRVPAIAGFELRQTLYDLSAKSEALQSEAQSALQEGAAAKARRDTARAAVLLYARCWADEARLASARRRQTASEAVAAHVEALGKEGRRTELDLERARLDAAKARQKTLDAQSDRDLDFRELKISIGAEPGDSVELAEDPSSAVAEVPTPADAARLQAEDPALQALDRQVEALRRSAEAARTPISPVVNAEGQYWRLTRANGYDRYYLRYKADVWSVGLSVAVPLWSGGRLEDARARIESRLAQAAADRSSRLTALELALARAQAALDRSEASASLAERAEGVSKEALRVSESLQREGRAEPDDIERKRIELSDSEDESVRAKIERLTARCDLLSLSGEIDRLTR
jgi:outer membrane protein TolC